MTQSTEENAIQIEFKMAEDALTIKREHVSEGFTKEIGSESTVSKNSTLSSKEQQNEARSIKKNLALIAVSSVLVTSPISGLMNSTTSLLANEGLGVTLLAVCSAAQFIASSFLLSYANKVWGIRKMVSASLMLPIPYIVSYVYPSWATILPAAILMGIGQSFISSVFVYSSGLGYYYTQITATNSDTILVAISGIMSSCLGGSFFFGNIIMFAVLNDGVEVDNSTANTNISFDVCGVQYCNQELTHLPTMRQPESWRYYTLVGVFSSMAVIGGLLTLFIRDFSKELGFVPQKNSDYFQVMKETLGLLKEPRGFLLIFFTLFIGLEDAFILADYTHTFISCSIGISKMSLVMMAYGGVQIVVCLLQGLLVKVFGRLTLVTLGILLMMSCFTTMFLWHPNSEQVEIFFIVAILWAAGDAILLHTSFAMYGIVFEDNIEGCMALGSFWWGLGFMLAFVWSQFLCMFFKQTIVIIIGCVGFLCYIMLEMKLRKKVGKKTSELTGEN